jgi:hypothetical protein
VPPSPRSVMASKRLHLTREEIERAFAGEAGERFGPILSPAKVAEFHGLSVKTIYEWMARGRLDGTYRGRGKHALFWRDRVIDAFFNGKEWST